MMTDDGAVGCICGCTCGGGGCGTGCGCGKFVRFLMDAELKKLTLKPCLRKRMMRTKCEIPTTTKTTADATPAVSPWFNSGGPESVDLSANSIRIVALHMTLLVPDARLHFPLRQSRCSLDAVQIVPQFATFAATHVAPVHDGEDDAQVMSHFVSEYPIESPYSYTPHYRNAKKTNKHKVSFGFGFKSNARGVSQFFQKSATYLHRIVTRRQNRHLEINPFHFAVRAALPRRARGRLHAEIAPIRVTRTRAADTQRGTRREENRRRRGRGDARETHDAMYK
jgi:hypothetical protein